MRLLKKNIPAFFLLFIGVIFLLCGIFRGDQTTIERKATVICLECIGIG